MTDTPKTPRFALGQVVATTPAVETMLDLGITVGDLVDRHVRGDWGNVPPEDAAENERSVRDGYRILSSYGEGDATLWVITEADRSVTTILRPEDY